MTKVMGSVRKRKRGNGLTHIDLSITLETKQPVFSGNVCKRCGSNIRHVKQSRCVRCYKQWCRDNEYRYYRKFGSALFRKLKITPAQYYEMVESQEWRCLICGQVPSKILQVDHCHKTNKIRGLLCGSCNVGLGPFRDDTARLSAAIEYLRKC